MFALSNGELLVNEVAPRPHNSGHYTIEACAASQFEQHLRAVLGWPLASTDLTVGARYLRWPDVQCTGLCIHVDDAAFLASVTP